MKKFLIAGLILLVIIACVGWNYYSAIYQSNTSFDTGKKVFIVQADWDYETLISNLEQEIVEDRSSFDKTASLKRFVKAKPGRYLVRAGVDNNALINMLRGGWQTPVKLTFNNARKPEDLAGKMATHIQLDSITLLQTLNSPELHEKYGFNKENFRTMFIPNTYEVYWDISASDLMARMAKEYKSFWTEKRKAKAKALNLSQSEVTSLASIVKAETAQHDEAPRVAGVYLNRLRIRMALQADPTLVFALNDFSIRRVLDVHKQIESPYNTYKYPGLPPGPINYPSAVYIDAVLDAEKHKYLYFCAKEDFSGYHSFAKTLSQHEANARRYRKALNESGIYR